MQVVELLLDKGANVSIHNTHNKTPLDLCTDEDVRNILLQFLNNAPPTTPSNVNGNKRNDKSPHPLFVSQTPPSHNISRRRPRRQVNSFVITPPTNQVKKKKNSTENVHGDQSPENKEVGGVLRPHPLKPVQLKLETNGENIENDAVTSNDNIDKSGYFTTGSQSNTDSVISTNDQSTCVTHASSIQSTTDESTTDQSTTVLSTIDQSTAEQPTIVQSTIEQPSVVESATEQSSIDQSSSVNITMPIVVHDSDDNNNEDDVFPLEAPAKLDPEEHLPDGRSSLVDGMRSVDIPQFVVQSTMDGSKTTGDKSLNSLDDQSSMHQPESQTQSPKIGTQSTVDGSQSLMDGNQSPVESPMDVNQSPVDATSPMDEKVSSLIVNISIDKIHLLMSNDSNHTSPLSLRDAGSGNIDTDGCSLSITSGGVSNVKDIDNVNVNNGGEGVKEGGDNNEDKLVEDTMKLLPDDEDSMSTVVSFSTSLPLVFGSRASSRSQSPAPSLSPTVPDPTPIATTPTPSSLLINTVKSGLPLRRGRSEEPPSLNYKSVHLSDGRYQLKSPPSIAIASSSMVKSPPTLTENERSVGEYMYIIVIILLHADTCQKMARMEFSIIITFFDT